MGSSATVRHKEQLVQASQHTPRLSQDPLSAPDPLAGVPEGDNGEWPAVASAMLAIPLMFSRRTGVPVPSTAPVRETGTLVMTAAELNELLGVDAILPARKPITAWARYALRKKQIPEPALLRVWQPGREEIVSGTTEQDVESKIFNSSYALIENNLSLFDQRQMTIRLGEARRHAGGVRLIEAIRVTAVGNATGSYNVDLQFGDEQYRDEYHSAQERTPIRYKASYIDGLGLEASANAENIRGALAIVASAFALIRNHYTVPFASMRDMLIKETDAVAIDSMNRILEDTGTQPRPARSRREWTPLYD